MTKEYSTKYFDWLTTTWETGQSFPPNLIRGLRTIFPEVSFDDARKIYSTWYQSYGSTNMSQSEFGYKEHVMTPLGPGRVSARGNEGSYLIDFFPEWFTPESWFNTFGVDMSKVGTGLTRFLPTENLTRVSGHRVITPRSLQQQLSQPNTSSTKKGATSMPKSNKPTLPEGEFEPGTDPEAKPKATAEPETIAVGVGTNLLTKRKGDRYAVTGISGDEVTLSWRDGKYIRKVATSALAKGYMIDSADPGVLPGADSESDTDQVAEDEA